MVRRVSLSALCRPYAAAARRRRAAAAGGQYLCLRDDDLHAGRPARLARSDPASSASHPDLCLPHPDTRSGRLCRGHSDRTCNLDAGLVLGLAILAAAPPMMSAPAIAMLL